LTAFQVAAGLNLSYEFPLNHAIYNLFLPDSHDKENPNMSNAKALVPLGILLALGLVILTYLTVAETTNLGSMKVFKGSVAFRSLDVIPRIPTATEL
jgi:hypothetical protein